LGILAAQRVSFKTQCDCFVTKRQANPRFALKEVTNQLRRSGAFATVFMGRIGRESDQQSVNLEEGGPRITPATAQRRNGKIILRCAVVPLREKIFVMSSEA